MEFEAEEIRVDDNLEVGEEMVDEEEVEVGEDKPKFVLVEFCQLEKLLQNQKRSDGWKKEIVEESLERKRRKGLREPMELVQDELDDT